MSQYKILLIIGNGFDLNLELPTSYKDFMDSEYFKKHVKFKYYDNTEYDKHDKNLFNYLQQQKNLKGWVDVEEELRKYASNQRVEYHYPEHRKASMPNSSDAEIRTSYNMLCQELRNYLSNLYYLEIDKSALALDILEQVALHEGNSIVTFNYTRLDRLANYINKKCKNIPIDYIHGDVKSGNIILGFQRNENIATGYEYMIKTRNPQYNSCHLSERMIAADEVIIFGHSLGSTDDFYFREYFKHVCTHKEKKTLTIFALDGNSRESLIKRIVNLTDNHLEELQDNVYLNIFQTKTDKERINRYIEDLKQKYKMKCWYKRLFTCF